MDQLTTGWIAGVLEGEGHFSIQGNTPKASFSSTDYDVIEMAQMAVGGNVGGPYQRGSNKPHWVWTLYGGAACKLMNDIYEVMSLHRRRQINKVFSTWKYIPEEDSNRRKSLAMLGRSRPKSGWKFSVQTRERMSAAAKIREKKKRAAKALSSV